MNNFEQFGISIPEILLPSSNVQLESWSVIACDQYTQDREYWAAVEKKAQGKPSTLHITLPEVYLNDSRKKERIAEIRSAMKEYCESGIFEKPVSGMMYIERTTAYGRTRKGLITAVDLEKYEWKPFSSALIRATEATIIDRIPPRMEIRRGAPLELPHIMLLVNDPDKELVEKTGKFVSADKPTYSTSLMMNSGSIKGWTVNDEKILNHIEKALGLIAKNNTDSDGRTFMFAVGDGNHSLATAKAVWDEYKTAKGGKKREDGTISIPNGFENHSARFALIEIVNLFDDGLTFEPIHRVLFNIDAPSFIQSMTAALGGKTRTVSSAEALAKEVEHSSASFGFVYEGKTGTEYTILETPITELAVSRLQPAIDIYLEKDKAYHPECEIDYIHGSEEVFRLGGKKGAVCVLLPPIAKESFFGTIAGSGPLPRKSFSMGEASEKRFYMECRKLFSEE